MTSNVIEKTWVAYGSNGVVGSVHRVDDGGYTFRLLNDESPRGTYPSLEIAKSALHAGLLPGSAWPEFTEH